MDNKEMRPEQLTWQTLIRSPLSFISLLKKNHAYHKSVKRMADHVADSVDPSIKSVWGYRKRLTPKILHCHTFCRNIVEQIPGPVNLDVPDYSSEPLVKAAFPEHDTMCKILHEAETFQPDINEEETKRVALLTMIHEEKDFFGTKKDGQMLVGDARLTSVNFSDHKIVGLATSLEKSRSRLENVIFEMIIEAAAFRLAGHKEEYKELKNQKEKLKAMLKIFGGPANLEDTTGGGAGEKLDKVKKSLQETENSLVEEKATVETPSDRLDFLVDFLSQPEHVMNIQSISLRLDWRKVITQDREVSADIIQLAQCTIPSEIKRDAVFIAYSTRNVQCKK